MTSNSLNVRTPVLAANWKMNLTPSAAATFMQSFLDTYDRHTDRTVIVFPSALSFAAVQSAVASRNDIALGVQNIHADEKGAYTGENSGAIAKDAGAAYVLVGHSERRHVFGETDEQTSRKCSRATASGLIPVLCVGEKIDEREAGNTDSVVLRQLKAGLAAHTPGQALLIAYEPVWAIGTGRTATPDDAAAVHKVIRAELSSMWGDDGQRIPILYGGSVTPQNASALLAARCVDGLLVGGASLDPVSWSSICKADASSR